MSMDKARSYPPLSGKNLIILTVALPLATFMQVMDATIANVAVPTISGNLGASYSQGTWIITSYSVANAIVLPLTGRLAKRIGEVRLFLWSTLLFTISSFLCGLAGDLSLLVFFRIIQGAVGGPMIPLAQSLLMNSYPKEKQVMALALWSMTVSVAPVFGPILGGIISDNYHWGWIFFINIPLGVLVLILTKLILGQRETSTERPRWSAISFALLAIGLGSLQMMLDRGKELDWFNSSIITSLAIIAAVGLILLIIKELYHPDPLLDLRLFKSRNFSIGVIVLSLGMMIYLGTVVLLPLLLQSQLGYTATWAGLATAPVGLLPIILTPLIGRYAHKVDLRCLITFGFLVFAFCMYLRTSFASNMDLGTIVWPQALQGLALACFFVPITHLTFMNLKPDQMAEASGLFNCIRTLFGAIGASVITTLWERREAVQHVRLSGFVDSYNPIATEALDRLKTLGLGQEESLTFLAKQISNQGFLIAATEIYQLCTFGFLIMIALIWLTRVRQDTP